MKKIISPRSLEIHASTRAYCLITRFRSLAIVAVFLAALIVGTVSAKPQHVVSINLCTDQLLMLLANRERIESVSYLAAKQGVSPMYKEAAGLHQNHGLAEEILLMKPDLVLAGTYTSRPTVNLLKRLGFNLLELPIALSIEDVRRNIRRVADAVGEPRRGEKLIDTFDQRLAAAVSTNRAKPVAVYYRQDGLTSGEHTLSDAILTAAGLTNLAAQLGIFGIGYVPLELLITHQPDIIVMHHQANRKRSVAFGTFQHSAFRSIAANRLIVSIPDELRACGTPFVVEAIDRLAATRRQWQLGKTPAAQIR